MNAARRALRVRRLGTVPYLEALELQAELVRDRREGRVPDTLLMLEHPHVITLGSAAEPSNVLVDDSERERLGIELHESGRGGDVTYHGPGQLVAYPILDLNPDRRDLHAYLRDLEEVVIRSASTFGVRAARVPGLTGVWVEAGKLAAIGVRVSSGWITSHGLALNVCSDLAFFDTIVPCGIPDRAVTSLEAILGRRVPMEDARSALVSAFAEVFDAHLL
jgi:lipoyl(octanoyl) transferase